MATNGAPDSWDDDVANTLTNKLADLNVEAPSFVPNVNANVFVPSWLPPSEAAAAPAKAPSPVVEQVVEQNEPSQSPSPTETQNQMQVWNIPPTVNLEAKTLLI